MWTIAWDVDDVLNDLMGAWLRQEWLPQHPQCKASVKDLRVNPPNSAVGVSLDEYLVSLDRFRRDRYLPELPPLPEATEWFERNGARYRHIALTAVPLEYAPVSAGWVVRHFGRWIRSFHFVPSKRSGDCAPQYDQSKQEFLDWYGKAAVLVDDHAGNIEAARKAGLRGVLVPRPWNNGTGTVSDAFQELENL